MNKFLQNWTYPKHVTTVVSLYIGIATLGNALFGNKIAKDEKSCSPLQICKSMSKKQKVFNGVLTGCFAFDMSVTYLVINHFKKQYK